MKNNLNLSEESSEEYQKYFYRNWLEKFEKKFLKKKSKQISEGIEQNSEEILAEIHEGLLGEIPRGTPEELLGVIAGGILRGVYGTYPW